MIEVTFRPLVWTEKSTHSMDRRSRHTFSASWSNTMDLLDRELRLLGATNLVIGAGFREQDIRLDGWPRANALVPAHPGVELSFDTKAHGRLVYATDVCETWQHNVRSIALGLESLRAVDRYGITRRGQQYAGFKQLAAGSPKGVDPDRGERLVRDHGGMTEAIFATHPDHGGDPDDLADVLAYRETLHEGVLS